jgi:hypothetical protein
MANIPKTLRSDGDVGRYSNIECQRLFDGISLLKYSDDDDKGLMESFTTIPG